MECTERTLACTSCGDHPTVEEFLDACHNFMPEVGAMKHSCQVCGESSDVQVLGERIFFGRAYGIDSPLFTPTHQVSIPGITEMTSSSSVTIYYNYMEWVISRPL